MSLMQPAEGRESYKAGSFPVKRKTSPRDAPLARKLELSQQAKVQQDIVNLSSNYHCILCVLFLMRQPPFKKFQEK